MLAQIEERFDGQLTIARTRYGDDVIVFSFAGELDLELSATARATLEPAFSEPDAMIVIDLTELKFIGVKGIHLLYELGRSRPGRESLRLLPSRHAGVNRVLRLTGVDSALPMVSP